LNFADIFGVRNSECGFAYMILCLAVLIQYRRVMDGRTDRQTDEHMMTANTTLA